MLNTPLYLYLLFIVTVMLSFLLIGRAFKASKPVLICISLWLLVQSVIAATGFYTDNSSQPPHMIAIVFPPILCIIYLFVTKKGRLIIDNVDVIWLNFLHLVRIPVEIVLLLLFKEGLVPKLMTFEGINFDIISGLTVPLIIYYGYKKKQLSKNVLLIWNLTCMALLFNIAYHGILSVPTPFQRFGFEQPNIGLTYFPYVLLPGFIVPAVLFAHLVSIRQLIKK